MTPNERKVLETLVLSIANLRDNAREMYLEGNMSQAEPLLDRAIALEDLLIEWSGEDAS